jgi:general secretion pathway protein A
MVLDYYKLREQPFGDTPNSRYLFMSRAHGEALTSLLYGIDSGCGFLALIAKPGLGKTTLLFHLLNQLREKALTVFLFQSLCTPRDLLRALLTGLGIEQIQGTRMQLQLRLKEILEDQARLGKRVVAVIDEAQSLDDSTLELVRMLSNFETSQEKLIQIVLSGQPQLAERIGSPGFAHLRQRVSIVAGLKPFSREDTKLYIDHRLRLAGYNFNAPLFTPEAVRFIADYTDGIPRDINNLCFNSLALGCSLQQRSIESGTVREVIAELDLGRWKKKGGSATRPLELKAQTGPKSRSTERIKSVFAGWISKKSLSTGWVPKIAILLLLVLVLGGVLFATRPKPTLKVAVPANTATPVRSAPAVSPAPVDVAPPEVSPEPEQQAQSVAPPLEVPNSSSLSTEQAPLEVATGSIVSVTPGKTLLGICVESFGKCDAELLREIRKLNPRLNDLDHIETGQTIRLPVSTAMAEQPGKPPVGGATRDE